MLNSGLIPQWLASLLVEKFFNTCTLHQEARNNEKNIFCLDCCHSICPHCVAPHSSHRLLQIRRYVYNDVLRLADAGKLMNCASVQIRHLLTTDQAGVSKILYNCQQLSLPEPGSEGGLMTPDSVLEPSGSIRTESGSSGSCGVAATMACQQALACTATTMLVKKKRSGFRSACRAMMNRPVCKAAVEVLNRPVSDIYRRKRNRPQLVPLY